MSMTHHLTAMEYETTFDAAQEGLLQISRVLRLLAQTTVLSRRQMIEVASHLAMRVAYDFDELHSAGDDLPAELRHQFERFERRFKQVNRRIIRLQALG